MACDRNRIKVFGLLDAMLETPIKTERVYEAAKNRADVPAAKKMDKNSREYQQLRNKVNNMMLLFDAFGLKRPVHGKDAQGKTVIGDKTKLPKESVWRGYEAAWDSITDTPLKRANLLMCIGKVMNSGKVEVDMPACKELSNNLSKQKGSKKTQQKAAAMDIESPAAPRTRKAKPRGKPRPAATQEEEPAQNVAAAIEDMNLEHIDDDAKPQKTGVDYRIEGDDFSGTSKERYENNIAALELLQQLETEGRLATPEEQDILARYTGWGDTDMANLFSYGGYNDPRWMEDARKKLRETMTDDEYVAARSSTTNAHYTPHAVIRGVWKALEHLGIKGDGIKILEPAAGTGRFFGLMPEDLRSKAYLTGVELDITTAKIAKHLYQNVNIHQCGFEEAPIANESFDLVVSNVPFGNYGVYDKGYTGQKKHLTKSIHNYFFAKALDKTIPGGTIAFVTSRYTMDSKTGERVRRYLADQADFIGAIRLPNTAFRKNAGAEVTTDVIILRKRLPGETPGDRSWVGLEEIDLPDGQQALVNKYFADNPSMMCGKAELSGTMYSRKEFTLASDGRDIGTAMDEAISMLPKGVCKNISIGRVHCPDCGCVMEDGVKCNNPNCTSNKKCASENMSGDGYYIGDDNHIYLSFSGRTIKHPSSGKKTKAGNDPMEIQRIRGLVEVRNALRAVRKVNIEASSDEDLNNALQTLNQSYDEFVKKYGYINERGNLAAFGDDPNLPYLLALESGYDAESHTASKADIFSKRMIPIFQRAEKADSAEDALTISLNETNTLNWQRMSELTGKPVGALQQELQNKHKIFKLPSGEYVPAEVYLSGNVRQKLRDAEAMAATSPSMESNVEALKAVLPDDITPEDIKIRLGVNWIPPDDVGEFARSLIGSRFDVSYIPSINSWKIQPSSYFNKDSASNRSVWGTKDMSCLDILDHTLNNKQITIKKTREEALNNKIREVKDKYTEANSNGDEKAKEELSKKLRELQTELVYDTLNEKNKQKVVDQEATVAARMMQDKIQKEFKRWVWEDDTPTGQERAKRLQEDYNELFNSELPRQYDDSPLQLPGLNNIFKLRPHQCAAIRQGRNGNNMGLFHVVGAGKTSVMIATGMELRRLGVRNKVMHTIPNSMIKQYTSDFIRMYPTAKLLAITEKDLNEKDRKKIMARIAAEDWDAVVVTHGALQRLPVSSGAKEKFLSEQIDEMRTALQEAKERDGRSLSVKELEKAIKRFEGKLKTEMSKTKQDNTDITWEELGVDQLFVDEADMFKNLYFHTSMSTLPGVVNKPSGRAYELYMKTRLLQEKVGEGKGVVFATGTPISNSVSEMYTMSRFLDKQGLIDKGLEAFDSWASTFGDTVTDVEMKPAGNGYRVFTRFAAFSNLPELKRMYMRFANVEQDPEKLGLPRPNLKDSKHTIVTTEASDELKSYVNNLAKRVDSLDPAHPEVDNMLKITGDGRKAALDLRMVLPSAPDLPDSKLNRAVNNIYETYKNTTGVELPGVDGKQNLSQVVFCDIGVEKNEWGFSVYEDIKNKLVRLGVKPEEIAFAQKYKKDEDKQKLYDKINSGEIRVVIGSTEVIGAGVNIQRRLAVMHELDAPWTPRSVEQREGRILRQGNLVPEVEIVRYLAEESFDVYNWQTLERKDKFIHQALDKNLQVRTIEDVGATPLNAAEAKALATGKPQYIERVGIERRVEVLEAEEKAHLTQVKEIAQKAGDLPKMIAQKQRGLDEAKRMAALVDDAYKQERAASSKQSKTRPFRMRVNGVDYDDKNKACSALADAEDAVLLKSKKGTMPEELEVGNYYGFAIIAKKPITKSLSPRFYVRIGNKDIEMAARDKLARMFPRNDNGRRAVYVLSKALDTPKSISEHYTQTLKDLKQQYKSVQGAGSGGAFEKADELERLRTRLNELNIEIDDMEQQNFAKTAVSEGNTSDENNEAISDSLLSLAERIVDAGGLDTPKGRALNILPLEYGAADLTSWEGNCCVTDQNNQASSKYVSSTMRDFIAKVPAAEDKRVISYFANKSHKYMRYAETEIERRFETISDSSTTECQELGIIKGKACYIDNNDDMFQVDASAIAVVRDSIGYDQTHLTDDNSYIVFRKGGEVVAAARVTDNKSWGFVDVDVSTAKVRIEEIRAEEDV